MGKIPHYRCVCGAQVDQRDDQIYATNNSCHGEQEYNCKKEAMALGAGLLFEEVHQLEHVTVHQGGKLNGLNK